MLERRSGPEPDTVEVTFQLPGEVGAESACLVGDFNGWSTVVCAAATPMQVIDGVLAVSLPLQRGRCYQFRDLLDNDRWENDWNADRYVPNPFGGDDSVVDLSLDQLVVQAAFGAAEPAPSRTAQKRSWAPRATPTP